MDVTIDPKTADVDKLRAEFLHARQAYHDARGRMLVKYLPWLDAIVSKAMRRLPPRVDRDELRSEAVMAMLGLLDRFDPARASFTTFARPRVVGAIGDWVRRRQLTRAEISLSDLLMENDRSG